MVLTVVCLIIAFFVVRAILLRAGVAPVASAASAFAVCAAFVIGSFTHPLVAPGEGPQAMTALPAGGVSTQAPAENAPTPPHFSDREVAALEKLPDAAPGSVDTVVLSSDRKNATVSGWVADPATRGTARGVILILDGQTRTDATPYYGQDRADVQTALHSNAALRTGFAGAVVPLDGLAKGKHTLTCAEIAADGKHYRLSRSAVFTY